MRAFLVSFNNPDICFLKQAKAEHAKLQRLDLYGYGFFVASGKAFLATTHFPINIDGMCFYNRSNGKVASSGFVSEYHRPGTTRARIKPVFLKLPQGGGWWESARPR